MNARHLLALACAALVPAAAHATDVSGLWVVSSAIAGAPVTLDCSVLQVGVLLSGSCEPESRDAIPAALQGRLDQTRASWTCELDLHGQPVSLAYEGVLAADSLGMGGTLTSDGRSAPLTAARK